MSHHRALNITLGTLLIAAICVFAPALMDTPSDLQATTHSQQTAHDAQRAAQRSARFERAARRMCDAEGAVVALLADGEIQCITQLGQTITAKVGL